MPLLWRPDDHRRNLRRRAPRALAIADPNQDRHIMTIAALPAAQRRSSSSPTTRRSTNPMSSRPPQTLSSRRAHTRRSHPRPRKSASCSLLTITSAAFHPRHHMGDPPRPQNPHSSRPAKPRLFLPAVSSLRGFRTPTPRPVPARLQGAARMRARKSTTLLVSVNSDLSDRVRSLPTSYPVGSCDPEP